MGGLLTGYGCAPYPRWKMRLLPVVCLLASCARASGPEDLLRAYRDALPEKAGRRAYELLSVAEKKTIPWDRFQLEWRANERERAQLAVELAHAALKIETRRLVLLPEEAFKQLLEAIRSLKKSLFISVLSPAFRKELLEQLHERERALESATPEMLEVMGDLARLRVGRLRIELRQIDGQWKVEDLN